MTDQLTRIERMLDKVLEKVDELGHVVTTLNKNLPEELQEIQGQLHAISTHESTFANK